MQTGDRVILIEKLKASTREFAAKVNWTEDRVEGLYFGYTPDDIMQGQWGCAMLHNEPKPFGITVKEILPPCPQKCTSFEEHAAHSEAN